MGLWSTISSVVSGACSIISSAVTIIGSPVAKLAMSIAEMGLNVAVKVGEIIRNIGINLGILKPEDMMVELGQKAMQCDKTPDDFDSISAYIDHLRNEVTIDKGLLGCLDEKELLARSAMGTAITLKGISEKLDTAITPKFIATVAAQNLETQEIISTIKTYKDKNLNTEDYAAYLKDELSIAESQKHSRALVEAYQKLEPELSIEQIEDKVMGLK